MKRHIKKTGGYIIILLTLLFSAISLAIVIGAATPITTHHSSVQGLAFSKQAYAAANSGIDEAIYRIKNAKTIGSTVTINLSTGSSTITVSNNLGVKKVTVTAATSSYQRSLQTDLSQGAGIAFNYGLQSDAGGVTISGGSSINGNVYSNGNINGTGGVTITGTAVAAGTSSVVGGGTYVGSLNVGSNGVGDAWAALVKGTSAAGTIYCNSTSTNLNNNKTCNTSKGTPPIQDLPFTDDDITSWENSAAAGPSTSTLVVGYKGATFGPIKVNGNLTVNGGGTLTLTGPLWVTGNFTVSNGGKVVLPGNYGKNSEVIVSGGIVTISGGGSAGSGTSGSYLFIVSTSTCPVGNGCSGNSAINITGGAGAIAVNAQSGTVSLSGGASLNAVTGYAISVVGGSSVTYNSGLASPSFTSGPSGGYDLIDWSEY